MFDVDMKVWERALSDRDTEEIQGLHNHLIREQRTARRTRKGIVLSGVLGDKTYVPSVQ